jgi:LPXTG-motif cell wall-anchored protein
MNSSHTGSYVTTLNGTTPPTNPPTTPPESGVLGEEDEQGVLADEDVLPKTGGIATSTALGLFGLVLLGTGTVLGLKKRRRDEENPTR